MYAPIQLIADEYPIILSLIYYATFIAIGQVTLDFIENNIHDWFQPYVRHATTTWLMFTISLENGNIRETYGPYAFFILVCLLRTWDLWYSIQCSCSSNPCSIIGHVIYEQRLSAVEAMGLFASQVMGMLVSVETAKIIWSFGLNKTHREQLARSTMATCVSKLTVTPSVGFCIEAAGTIFNYVVDRTELTFYSPLVENEMKIVMMTAMQTYVSTYTGFYLNPLKASSQTIGCAPTAVFDHVLVYWIGPLIAVTIASFIRREVSPPDSDW